jgi:hypothetical protein
MSSHTRAGFEPVPTAEGRSGTAGASGSPNYNNASNAPRTGNSASGLNPTEYSGTPSAYRSGNAGKLNSKNSKSNTLSNSNSNKQLDLFSLSNDPANRRTQFSVGMLLLSAVLLHADQNLAFPNLSAIARDFDFNEKEKDMKLGGETQFGFFLIGGLATLLIGPMADSTTHRIRLLVAVIWFGSVPCALTMLLPNGRAAFPLFMVQRVLTGVSVRLIRWRRFLSSGCRGCLRGLV